jgi:glycosyltransferase involved in cell wall biosynthesis
VGADRDLSGVRWIGWKPGDGFGDAAQGYMEALDSMGVPVTYTPIEWIVGEPEMRVVDDYAGPLARLAGRVIDHDTVVVHIPPGDDRWLAEAGRRRVALQTTWESDRVPDGWMPSLDRYDVVLVPSTFNRDALTAAGCPTPVHVVPHVANAPTDAEPARYDRIGDRYLFYVIATWSTRKAMAETVTAFLDAFDTNDDVALVVKTTTDDQLAVARSRRAPDVDTRTWVAFAKLLAGRRRVPEVQLVTGHMPRADIDALHTRGDCFFSLTRSEGWGLSIADALAHGNPVVVTGWGGHLDYLGADYPLLVDYDLAPTALDPADDWFETGPGHHWARARHDHAVDLLRWVAANPENAAATAAPLGDGLRQRCAPGVIGRQLVEILSGVVPRRSRDRNGRERT